MLDRLNLYKQLLSRGVTEHGCVFCDNCDANIIRGSTVQHSFRLPFRLDIPKDVLIIYTQDNKKVLEKKLVDVKIHDDLIYFDLLELDTLKFKPDNGVSVQLRTTFKDNRVITSDVFTCWVIDVIDDQVLTDQSTSYYAIEASINAQRIEVQNYFDLIQGSSGLYKCKLFFDSTWDKFKKKAIFKDQYNHKIYTDIYEDDSKHYECLLPDILIDNPGWINMGVAGSFNNGKVKANKPTMWSRSLKVPRSCATAEEFDKNLEFDKLYVYQGVVDDAYTFKVPQELEVTAVTKQELLNGYTWDGYWLNNQYHILAIPSIMNVECEKVIQNDFTILPTSHLVSDNGKYTFYYFSSKATGEFTSTYYFKEVK